MHIGFFDTNWRGHHTPYISLLSRFFADRGHDVTFVTDERHERLDELPETERLSVVAQPFPKEPTDTSSPVRSLQDQFARTRQLRATLRIADRERFDVVHLLYFDRTQVPLRVATLLRQPDVPVVATQHRDAFVTNSTAESTRLPDITTWALNSTIDDGVLDLLTVHADDIRDRILDAVPSATTSTVQTIPAPTPDPEIMTDTAELRADLDLPPGRDLILFFGGLRHEKGPDILADQLREVDRPLTLVFAGSPADFSEDDVDNWRSTVSSAVEIVDRLEYIPEAEVDRYFAAVDATVLPYRRERGISGPLRRSAMVGTPVIGTAETDVGRLIERHDIGATFDPDDRTTFSDALDRTLDADSTVHSALKTFASSRHWERTGEVLHNIYEALLAM